MLYLCSFAIVIYIVMIVTCDPGHMSVPTYPLYSLLSFVIHYWVLLFITEFLLSCKCAFSGITPTCNKQLHTNHLPCMWRLEPMLARSHTMPARGSFWPLWSDRRLYKVTMHWLHKFEANPADHQAVMWFFALGPPGWRREVRSAPFTSLFSPLGQSQPSCHQNAQ